MSGHNPGSFATVTANRSIIDGTCTEEKREPDADLTAARVRSAGLQTARLLGTVLTMEQDFYKGRLADQRGLTVLIPDEADRALAHR